MSIASKCRVLSGRGLCVELITRPEESTEWGVSVFDRRASIIRRPCPHLGSVEHWKKKVMYELIYFSPIYLFMF